MFFDARAAKQLTAGQYMVIQGCPGLRLVASATRKTWTYRYKEPGSDRMKQVSFGQWPAVSVQAASAQWQSLRDERSAGVDPGDKRRSARKALRKDHLDNEPYKVRTVIETYLDRHVDENRKAAGAQAARRALERLMEQEPAFADQAAASITRAQAFDLLDARKVTPTATAKLRSMLGSAWEAAIDSGRLEEDVPNWWRKVMQGRLKSKGKIVGGRHIGQQRRVLQPHEISHLLRWLPNMHELGRDTLQLYLWTCVRGVEILGMRPEHVGKERDGWWWTIPKELTKNADVPIAVDLRVPLIGRALAIVRRRLKQVGDSGWLFEDMRGEQYTQHDFSTYIYSLQPHSAKAKRRQGGGLVLPVSGWTPHDLRRTGRTMLSSLRCPEDVAEAILGHVPQGVVGVYNAYTYDAERRLWLGLLADRLEELCADAHVGLPERP